jgi:hypothetical protein
MVPFFMVMQQILLQGSPQRRLSNQLSVPFELRLRNGMNPPVPEVTVLIHRITKDRRAGEYRLHIKKVLNYKHWDKRRGKPKR